MSRRKVLIAAGGTGGHIYPGIALASALTKKDYDVVWLGSGSQLEKNILKPYGWHYQSVNAKPFRGTGIFKKLILPIHLIMGVILSLKSMYRYRPAYLITTGGYVAITSSVAAYIAGVPVYLCEQNAKPGLANRCLSRIAKKIFTAYPEVFPQELASKTMQTGNPLREDLIVESRTLNKNKHGQKKKILILGGSQGARVFNEKIPVLLGDMQNKDQLSIVHVAGKHGDVSTIKNAYENSQLEADICSFIEDMASCYADVDLVIARSGALTLTELMQFKLPSILVPLPNSADNHQFYNALYHHHHGACWLIDQSQLAKKHYLANIIHTLLQTNNPMSKMRNAAARLQTPQATEQIISHCEQCADEPI